MIYRKLGKWGLHISAISIGNHVDWAKNIPDEQTWYNMVGRKRVENDLLPLLNTYGMGITAYSSLAGGFLTGKYLDGVPEDSRMANKNLDDFLAPERVEVLRQFVGIANDLGTKMPILALA